jgi:hypothetical protein
VPFDSFVPLCFSAPFSLLLCLYDSATIIVLRTLFCSILTYVPIEGCIVYLVLLKSRNVLIQLFSTFGIGYSVKNVGICEIGSVELKIQWVIY